MPSPKECALKFKPGSKEYNDCVAYKKSVAKKPVNEMSRVKSSKTGGY